jgi:hypothetical protein
MYLAVQELAQRTTMVRALASVATSRSPARTPALISSWPDRRKMLSVPRCRLPLENRSARPVIVGAVLLFYVACVGTLGSRMLGRASWTAWAPLLAIVIYLAADWSVLAALGLAGLTLAVHATALGGGLSHLIGACVLRLRATYATPGGATVTGLGLTLAGAVLARTAVTATTHLRAPGRQASRHAQTARLVGVPEPALGAVLVEHAQPAAYSVAGRHPGRAGPGQDRGAIAECSGPARHPRRAIGDVGAPPATAALAARGHLSSRTPPSWLPRHRNTPPAR